MARFVEHAANVAFTIACAPIICAYLVASACFCPSSLNPTPPFSQDKEEFERRQHFAPRPLPTRPPERSLTIPLPGLPEEDAKEPVDTKKKRTLSFPKPQPRSKRTVSRKTLSQSQSSLFDLPFELRLLIYKYAVGNRTIHIIQRKHRLGHIECSARPGHLCPILLANDHHHRFPQCLLQRVDSSSILVEKRRKNPLNLRSHQEKKQKKGEKPYDALCTCSSLNFLVSCRRVYSEALSSLYASNTFVISDLTCLSHLHATTLPHRFAQIQTLHIQWACSWPVHSISAFFAHHYGLYPPYDEATWKSTWALISTQLPQLKNLKVEIHSGCWTNLVDAPVLNVICNSRVPVQKEKFIVEIDWPLRDHQIPEDAPFTLARPKWGDGLGTARSLADLA